MYLNLSKNKIKAVAIFTQEEMFPNLKWLDVSSNKLTELPGFKLPKLEYLDISNMNIEKINDGWAGHANLKVFKCFANKFKSLAQFKAMPKCEELYASNNQITVITGWEGLPIIKKLHLRRNKIEKVDEELAPSETLEYLNLRANKIAGMDQIERLYKNPLLTDINVLNNPVESNASSFNVLLAEVLAKNPKVKRFCKHDVQESNLLEAVFYKQYKWGKAEEARKKQLAEEKAKAAAED